MASDRPSFLRRWLRFSEEEWASAGRTLRYVLSFFAFCVLALLPIVRSGYFKDQAQQKQARHLIETGGYAYCAIWGDGTDPLQLTAMNSPYHPMWKGARQPTGVYVMTFWYRKSGKEYRHEWEVNLAEKRVKVLSEDTRFPVADNETERSCSEQ